METTRPVLRRAPDGALAGVAAGLADHLGVSVVLVRVVFLALTYFEGFGAVLYLGYWAWVPLADYSVREERRRLGPLAVFAVTMGCGGLLVLVGSLSGRLVVPVVLVAGGLVLVWRQADDAIPRPVGRVAVGIGGVLLVAGLAWLLVVTVDRSEPGMAFMMTAGVLLAAAAVGWPWWRRLAAELGAERRARIRSQERAEVAAHLHDSVLQTLTLIQRNVRSPLTVQRLARRQERELREWLSGRPAEGQPALASAVRAAADDVEDDYGVIVDLVVVGDAPMDDRLAALVQAAREAMVNAARHSGETTISAYVEVEPERVTAYVRDRGRGFDPDAAASGRYGLAQSVVGRMERHGGRAVVNSAPGEGTEVELELTW